NGQGRVGLDRRIQNRQPVSAGESPIGQHQIEALAPAEPLNGQGAVLDPHDLESLSLEHLLEDRAQGVLVLDDQNAGHGHSRVAAFRNFGFWILDCGPDAAGPRKAALAWRGEALSERVRSGPPKRLFSWPAFRGG